MKQGLKPPQARDYHSVNFRSFPHPAHMQSPISKMEMIQNVSPYNSHKAALSQPRTTYSQVSFFSCLIIIVNHIEWVVGFQTAIKGRAAYLAFKLGGAFLRRQQILVRPRALGALFPSSPGRLAVYKGWKPSFCLWKSGNVSNMKSTSHRINDTQTCKIDIMALNQWAYIGHMHRMYPRLQSALYFWAACCWVKLEHFMCLNVAKDTSHCEKITVPHNNHCPTQDNLYLLLNNH